MPKQKEQFEEMRLQTIQKLQKAGLKLFAQKGLAATNIKEIAKEAQVSLGLLYHYYSSKEELYLSLANEAMEKSRLLAEQMNQLEGSVGDKLSLFVEAFLNGVQKEDGIYYFIIISQLFETGNPEADRQLLDKKRQAIENLARLVEQGQKDGECVEGDPFQLAAALISATQGIASFRLMFGEGFGLPDKSILLRILTK
ncbi:TetR/AcrR family transcriptional regulator [Paenibacillus aurantius]|uniref:TetR/AcrR family transcriptional regulator n=1 Tax=Paenibacillus aurantius TaxID=2918900 RepID=A0AA96LF72_9BACL|nr:TetR/AcrR family transcriptional regulator [Paenibacillus aurantius]WNQ11928.1 TetR/AcrR family transcriptional regulator [Paenibacillus aurantius]